MRTGHGETHRSCVQAGLVEWLAITGPPGVRDHLASIGTALVALDR
jgi:hypothetical protein